MNNNQKSEAMTSTKQSVEQQPNKKKNETQQIQQKTMGEATF